MKSIAIIGAGASGLACATTLAKANKNSSIYLIDKNIEIGKKLNVTGNGRCNLSNHIIDKQSYHGDTKGFYSIADEFDAVAFFSSLGLQCRTLDDLIYPYSLQAKSVSNIFKHHLENKIQFYLQEEVISIEKQASKYRIHTKNHEIKVDMIVLATGGLAGNVSNKAGYDLLEQLGIHYTKLLPSLVQIETKEKYKALKGTRIKAKVSLCNKNEVIREEIGEVLFTDYGLSGISIFQLTSELKNAEYEGYQIKMDIFPEYSINELSNILKQQIKILESNHLSIIVSGLLPQTLCFELPKMISVKEINYSNSYKISEKLKEIMFSVTTTKGFTNAQVTKGGIPKKELNQNLSLRKHPNIFVCGELLDIDGDCGGFNLHFAFASGYYVANKITELLVSNNYI